MKKDIELIINHYNKNWDNFPEILSFEYGPVKKLYDDFKILEYPPNDNRSAWTYATCGMGLGNLKNKHIELHMFSSRKDRKIVEILTAIAYYHKNTIALDLDHTVNFGVSWQDESLCDHGLISLPYLDGPELEKLNINKENEINFYWLIPITIEEVNYKIKFGIDELESKFDNSEFDYLDPKRISVI